MRIAHICQSADPSIGGSLTVARALVKAQREEGVDARLVFLYASRDAAVQAADTQEIFCQVDRQSRWFRGIRILRRELEKISPDIIHHHDGIFWPRLATVGLGPPLFTHAHLERPEVSAFSAAYWTHRYIASHTDCLLAISDWVRESWVRGGFPREQTRLISNGVDCAQFYPRPEETRRALRARFGLPSDQKLLLWAGRLDGGSKGLNRLVATARVLPAGVRLIIAGDGPSRTQLVADLKALHLDSPPILLGMLHDPAELFGTADAFLFTSIVEAFGLVLLEAAASGLPIFAFECVGGAKDLLHQLGATVLDEGSIADSLSTLTAASPSVKRGLLERVRQKYSWTTVSRATLVAYGEVGAGLKAK